MKLKIFSQSLAFKLMVACAIVQLLMLGLLTVSSWHIMREKMIEHSATRLHELELLLNTSLSAPLVQRDYESLHSILRKLKNDNGLTYLVLVDHVGRILVNEGWDNSNLPLLENENSEKDLLSDNRLDAQLPIQIEGQLYGTLHFGFSTKFIAAITKDLLLQSLMIGMLVIGISVLLMLVLGYWLTRNLRRLSEASAAVAAGDFNINLPTLATDEVGQLTKAFNVMAQAVREQVVALKEGEERFHAIADYTYHWESWISPSGKLIWVNSSVERLTGYTPEECFANEDYPFFMVYPEDLPIVKQEFSHAFGGSIGTDFEFRVKRKDESIFWAAINWQPIYGPKGEYLGTRTSVRNIDKRKEGRLLLEKTVVELKQAQESQQRYLVQSREEHARLVSLLSAMNIGILFVSIDNRVIYSNPAFLRIWMIRDTNLIGKPAAEVLSYSANILARPDHFSKHILQVLETHESSESFEIQMADGRVVVQLSYPVRDDEGRFIGRLWIYEDVTRERQTAEQLIYLAERDSLTGLYNRHRFQDQLTRLMAEVERHNSTLALLFFDLDEFKYVNDTFGHRAGDSMLIRVAGEVSVQVRRNEIFARLGGDEFAILAPDISENEAQILAERIVRSIAQIPFRFEGQNLRLTSSLGIAIYPQHASNAEDLVAHADSAMYQAKEAGKNAWRIYRHDLDTGKRSASRQSWSERTRYALQHDLMRLHFQGVYKADTGALSHLEVLVRMIDEQHPERIIMPGHFIPAAEKNNTIIEIDRWVINEAIKLLAKVPTIPALAINISGRSFDDPTLVQYIGDLLDSCKVKPNRLMIELTETSAVSDLHDAQRFIEGLHQKGCGVCLDDFGTGFSSFAYLKHLRADILKIDGLFIRDLPNDRDNQVFVKSIIDVARGMHKTTVAEFVEDEETLEMLKRFGIDMVQGYYLDMPTPDHPAVLENINLTKP